MHQNRRSAEELRRPLRVLRHCLQEIQQGRYSSSEIALKLHRIEPDTQLNTVIFELLRADALAMAWWIRARRSGMDSEILRANLEAVHRGPGEIIATMDF